MNIFAKFDENPAITLQVIKKTKRYGRTDARTHGQTDRQTDGRENSIPHHKQSLRGGIKKIVFKYALLTGGLRTRGPSGSVLLT